MCKQCDNDFCVGECGMSNVTWNEVYDSTSSITYFSTDNTICTPSVWSTNTFNLTKIHPSEYIQGLCKESFLNVVKEEMEEELGLLGYLKQIERSVSCLPHRSEVKIECTQRVLEIINNEICEQFHTYSVLNIESELTARYGITFKLLMDYRVDQRSEQFRIYI